MKSVELLLLVIGIISSMAQDPPKQHIQHGSCKLYLNEVFLPSFPANLFVEIGKHCPSTASEGARRQTSMLGYQVLVLAGTNELKVYARRALDGEDLSLVKDVPLRSMMPKLEETPPTEIAQQSRETGTASSRQQLQSNVTPIQLPSGVISPVIPVYPEIPAAYRQDPFDTVPQYQQVPIAGGVDPFSTIPQYQQVPVAVGVAPLSIIPQYQHVPVVPPQPATVQLLPVVANVSVPVATPQAQPGFSRPAAAIASPSLPVIVIPPPPSAPQLTTPHPLNARVLGQRSQPGTAGGQFRQEDATRRPATTTPPPMKATRKEKSSIFGKLSRKPRRDPHETQNPQKVVSLFAFNVPKEFPLSDNIFAIVLLYYGREARDKKLHLNIKADSVITEESADNIRTHMIDAVVYGKIWEEDAPQGISRLFETAYGSQKNYVFLPHRNNEVPGLPAGLKSVSRCDNRGDGFRAQGFKYSAPTFGMLNECEAKNPFVFPDYTSVSLPYTFRGIGLTVDMKKMVLNINTAFDALRESDSFPMLTPAKKSALVTNLNYDTVLRIVRTYEQEGKFEAAGRKPYVSKLQKRLEKIDLTVIDEIIKGYYKQNKDPVLNEIYHAFVTKVREDELRVAEAIGPVNGEADESLPPLFSCSKESFRSLLHKLGYVYGKLNTRSVILQDERIVRLRYKYLKRIRENDALGSKQHPVVYLDETWFDPYSRKSYGWRPRHPSSYKEASEYTYQSHKVGRGPRLIILHAGGLGGMVPDSGEVYAVSKNQVNEDYHANVHGERFEMWFSKLLDNLDKLGRGKHLIVLDNARYHTVYAFPNKNANKPVLLEFLLKKQGEGKLQGITINSKLRKWELQDILESLKEIEPPYKIDRMAAARGHEVVRLPPYNCDLNPIEMVWAYVKGRLRTTNYDQDLKEVKRRAEVIVNSVTKEMWQPYVAHVKKLEQSYWEQDGHYDRYLETHPDVQVEEILGPEGEVGIEDLEFDHFEEDWDEENTEITDVEN